MPRAVVFFALNLGIFLAFASRKRADSDRVVSGIRSHANNFAALQANAAKSSSEDEQLGRRLEDAVMDNDRADPSADPPSLTPGPWSKVQIWGWFLAQDDKPNVIWGLTDGSGYLPQKLQRYDPKLQLALNGFSTFREYEAWLKENRATFGGDSHIDLYSPFVVVDGSYVGGYAEFVKAIAENYPDALNPSGTQKSQVIQKRRDDETAANEVIQNRKDDETAATVATVQVIRNGKDDETAAKEEPQTRKDEPTAAQDEPFAAKDEGESSQQEESAAAKES